MVALTAMKDLNVQQHLHSHVNASGCSGLRGCHTHPLKLPFPSLVHTECKQQFYCTRSEWYSKTINYITLGAVLHDACNLFRTTTISQRFVYTRAKGKNPKRLAVTFGCTGTAHVYHPFCRDCNAPSFLDACNSTVMNATNISDESGNHQIRH